MATQENAWGTGDANSQGEAPSSAFSKLNVNAPEFVPSFLVKSDPPATNSNDNSSNISPGGRMSSLVLLDSLTNVY